MNEKMIEAMNAIVSDLEKMSDSELKAKFDAFEAGAIGYAILGSEPFIADLLENFFGGYQVSKKDLRGYIKSSMNTISHIGDYFESANDDCFEIAA